MNTPAPLTIVTTTEPLHPWKCSHCETFHRYYVARCENATCRKWNTIRSTTFNTANAAEDMTRTRPVPITSVPFVDVVRFSTGFPNLDDILGAPAPGMPRGGSVILGAFQGTGKTTLFLQILGNLARSGQRGLFAGTEQPAIQIRQYAERLGVAHEGWSITTAPDAEGVARAIREVKPVLTVVDSLQTIATNEYAPGTVGAAESAIATLLAQAQASQTALVLINHVTKDGGLAGRNKNGHACDIVLLAEATGDTTEDGDAIICFRIGGKNRFGPVTKKAHFIMTKNGLEPMTIVGGDKL